MIFCYLWIFSIKKGPKSTQENCLSFCCLHGTLLVWGGVNFNIKSIYFCKTPPPSPTPQGGIGGGGGENIMLLI